MAKKKQAMQSTESDKSSVDKSDDLLDEVDGELDEGINEELLAGSEKDVDQRMAVRRRLEQYLEDRRLRKELGDDLDFYGDLI